MTVEEQLNQKQEEIHNLQMRLKNKCEEIDALIDKIKNLIKEHEKKGENDDEVYWC